MKHHTYFKPASLDAIGFTPAQVAGLYQFPKVDKAQPKKIALIELGGGYSSLHISNQFSSWGLPYPKITDHSILGNTNSIDGRADVEVVLDIVVAAAAWSYCTELQADIHIYFAPNSDAGFIAAVKQAGLDGMDVCSISWGSPENTWSSSSLKAMDAAFSDGSKSGTTYTCASGDNGSSDGEGDGKDHTDFPGSSPYVVCCGATTISVASDLKGIIKEVPWNAGGGATGGGFSSYEPIPGWQKGFVPDNKTRGVPDLCANGDPATGYITPFGVIGGTSAVAPLIAALFAVYKSSGLNFGLANPILYANEPSFTDIVEGNNTTGVNSVSPMKIVSSGCLQPRWPATKGWDAASGLGSPKGFDLWVAFQNCLKNPNPPVPSPPVIIPPPIPTPPSIDPAKLQEIMDGIFFYLETQFGSHPVVEKMLGTIQLMADQEILGLWTFLHDEGLV